MNERASRIKVCTPERMCFYINAKTLEPETASVYDAWCFADPDGPTLSYAEWLASRPSPQQQEMK